MGKLDILTKTRWASAPNFPSGGVSLGGKPICLECGKGHTLKAKFCSKSCEEACLTRSSSDSARRIAFEKDAGVCSLCGLDTETLAKEINRLYREDVVQWKLMIEEYGIPRHRVTLWDLDHILPVNEGGGSCNQDNLRTLCMFCHRARHSKKR